MKKNVMGIDPGKSGGWALTTEKGETATGVMPIIGNEIDVREIAEILLSCTRYSETKDTIVVIEKVHAMPKQGVSSTFNFGVGYGKLLGMCQTLGISFDLVSPQNWKKTILKDTKKDKNAAIDYVRRLFPKIELVRRGCRKPHDGIADAVCLMQWGVEKYGMC